MNENEWVQVRYESTEYQDDVERVTGDSMDECQIMWLDCKQSQIFAALANVVIAVVAVVST